MMHFILLQLASLVVVGDIDEASILSKLDFLKTWKGAE